MNIFEKIREEWKESAESVNRTELQFFYKDKIVESLKQGRYYMLLGSKGLGKTAIYNYLLSEQQTCSSIYIPISLNNLSPQVFSFCDDYSYDKNVALWKLIFYANICARLDVEPKTIKLLKFLFPAFERDKRVSIKDVSLKIFNAEFSISFERNKEELSIEGAALYLENYINSFKTTEPIKFFLLIDDLDRDWEIAPEDKYINFITSLFVCVNEISINRRAEFGVKIFPIVFLRTEIYKSIKHNKKTNWRNDYGFELKWNLDQPSLNIKDLLQTRINRTCNKEFSTFEEAWEELFDSDFRDSFGAVRRLTRNRPRDYVRLIIFIANAKKDNKKISYNDFCKCLDGYSQSLIDEILEETNRSKPELKDYISLLERFNKKIFTRDEAENSFKDYLRDKKIKIDTVLETLYEYNIIGTLIKAKKGDNEKRNFAYFRPNYNNTCEKFVLHEGLSKHILSFANYNLVSDD